jgi:hypothetical protein
MVGLIIMLVMVFVITAVLRGPVVGFRPLPFLGGPELRVQG